jgi:hypothetical protein
VKTKEPEPQPMNLADLADVLSHLAEQRCRAGERLKKSYPKSRRSDIHFAASIAYRDSARRLRELIANGATI